MQCKFHHVALVVTDYERTVKFYSDVLGMTVQSSWQDGNTKAAMLEMSDGALIEIFDFGTAEPEERPRWLHLAVIVDDVDAVYEKALQCGATTDRSPFDVPNFKGPGTNLRLAFVKGPDGELIELYHEDQ